MKKTFLAFGLLLSIFLSAQESRDIEYIRKHALLAVQEMHIYKIPASITLSQGILETGGGQSRLAEQALNHFGIKCKPEWKGDRIYHDDDAKGECFRKYNDVAESYRDHSKFLAERPYYKNLFNLSLTDYKGWAHGLKKAGYATNPKYGQILITRIEKYNLNQFDLIQPQEVKDKLAQLYGNSPSVLEEYIENEVATAIVATNDSKTPNKTIKEKINKESKHNISIPERVILPRERIKKHPIKVDYIVALKGETLASIANLYDKKAYNLARYNEIPSDAKLTEGQLVFFGYKKKRGIQPYYVVQAEDNIYLISQKAGIRINNLYRLNRLSSGSEPVVGTKLNLINRVK